MNGTVAPDDVKHSLALYMASQRRRFSGDGLSHAPSFRATAGKADLKELKGWTTNFLRRHR